jgi:hypothetical protein
VNEGSSPQASLREGYQVRSMVATETPAERTFALGYDEFRNLCDENNGAERAGKDLCLGLCFGALVGLISVISTVDWDTIWMKGRGRFLLCSAVLLAIAAGSAAGATIYWRKMAREDTAYSRLRKKISEFFEPEPPK